MGCTMYWGNWVMVHANIKPKLVGSLVVALLFSVFGGLLVLFFDMYVRMAFAEGSASGLKGVISGVGLLIGFTWELSFDISLENLAEGQDYVSEVALKVLL